MTWFKIDDRFHNHPKVLGVGNAAAGLFVRFGSYSSQQTTDGFIPAEVARMYGTRGEVTRLVDAGLIVTVEGGYQIPDFLEFNPSAEEVEDRRAKRADAGRRGGIASGITRRNRTEHEANSEANPKQMLHEPLKQTRTPSRPVPSPLVNGCTESSRRLTVVHPAGRDDDLEAVLQLVTNARVDGARNVRNRRSYSTAVMAEARLQDGELARSLLTDGSTIEQTAMFILGHGIGAEAEHHVTPDAWCDPTCEACHGDHWIDDGTDRPAPCPNGPRAQKASTP